MSLAELPEHPFAAPRTLDELTELLAGRAAAGEETVLLAGGTDWIVERHLAPPAPGRPRALVADVSRLAELRGVDLRGDTLDIGAAATFLEIARSPVVEHRVPLLGSAFRDVGAVQIQARGTLGGNLATASPAADGVAALAALDATLVLASVRGTRRVPRTLARRIVVSRAASAATPSPAGEAVARLPPSVPRAWIWTAPTARPAMVMPANTRSANSVRMTRSLNVPGSPSSALQMMYFLSPFSEPAKFHFMPVGKPAPPRPFMPEADTVSMMSARDMARAALRPALASMEAKVRVFP